ncbi:DUF4252 domain-containing protein [Aquimarina brevivitae]|uniref:Uncharacterized protein DUF4252 n=1 Tax=Aquimarina brevivitae TaxID=323412 RepID=A0A4Q7P113_9FLAO|nr:DUF4252 domain-containing protein [Aquimarina brevivitae]RZS93503.1 uncharacterized protein DUF4252 [Aquimarina brevivitae]
MKYITKILALLCLSIVVLSCNNEPSLQQYYVDHQNDQDFIAVDIPSSLLNKDKVELSKDEKEALESIKKVNFLAIPLNENNKNRIAEESEAINKILSAEKYQTLMRFGSNGMRAVLKYQGEDDDIDEVIVFATDQEKGLALVRLLGDNMRPEKMAMLMKSVEKGNVNLSAFESIAKSFD